MTKDSAKDTSRPTPPSKKSSMSGLNFLFSLLIAGIALWFFAGGSTKQSDDKQPLVQTQENESAEKKSAAKVASQPEDPSFQKAAVSSPYESTMAPESAPSDLPEGLRRQIMNSPTTLPPEMQAQLEAAPPELPEDLKKQLAMPPRELPADMAAQVMGAPPELPDDIKKALKTPPRVVTVEEVNTPPEPEF